MRLGSSNMPTEFHSVVPSLKLRNFRNAAVNRYASQVAQALPYLLGRGLTEESVRRWKIGYVDDPLGGHEIYEGRISIPYWSAGGYLAINFRCIHEFKCNSESHKKYMFEQGGYRRLFNVRVLEKGLDKIYVTEGELDAIAATESGLPAVGIPMAGAWEPHWDSAFSGPSQVVAIIDADDAGRELVRRLRSKIGHKLTPVRLPAGEDVSSYVQSNGAEGLRELVKNV